MNNPVFHQGTLFVAHENKVLTYTVRGEKLVAEEPFPFLDTIINLKSLPAGLLVTTEYEWFVIAGGPSIASYYSTLLAHREEGLEIEDNLCVAQKTYLSKY